MGFKMMDLSFFKSKKVLVTGHTGFKGSWLCRILMYAGASVTGYSLEPAGEPNLFSLAGLEQGIRSETGDVRDYRRMAGLFKEIRPEIVFHLAAQPIVREGYLNPRFTYETNVMGTVNLLECVRKTDSVKSLVNVTTDKVYKNNEQSRGYREEEPLDGFDPYSNSKSKLPGCLYSQSRKCYRRRRLWKGPDHSGLYPRSSRRTGDRCKKPVFNTALSACTGLPLRLSDDRSKAI